MGRQGTYIMKRIYKRLWSEMGLTIAVTMALLTLVQAPTGQAETTIATIQPIVDPILAPNISEAQRELGQCESNGNQNAVNPKDRDGTSSNGKYQFKRSTWRYFVHKYDLWNSAQWDEADYENTLFSDWHQDVVVSLMFIDPDVNLHQQFPVCADRLRLKINYASI